MYLKNSLKRFWTFWIYLEYSDQILHQYLLNLDGSSRQQIELFPSIDYYFIHMTQKDSMCFKQNFNKVLARN